jgi:hypothetical protein
MKSDGDRAEEVAVKYYKGETTSDGRPEDEIKVLLNINIL